MSRVNNRQAKYAQGSGNFNVQASLDVRDLATLAEFLVSKGEIKEGKYGQIISWCFELGLSFVRRNYVAELQEYESIEQAIAVLKSMDYSVDQFKIGGNRQLVKGMANEAMQMDFGSGVRGQQYVAGQPSAHTLDIMPTQQATYIPTPSPAVVEEPKPVSLDLAIEAAKQMFDLFGTKHPDFLWLWDKTIPDPRMSQETRDRIAFLTTPEEIQKVMDAHELQVNPPQEERDKIFREKAIEILVNVELKRIKMPPELEYLLSDLELMAEVGVKAAKRFEENERLLLAREEERKRAAELKR